MTTESIWQIYSECFSWSEALWMPAGAPDSLTGPSIPL